MVKLLKRLRKKKTSYVEVEKHSKVKNTANQWDNKASNQNKKSMKEDDREQLSSLSTRSMSTVQRGQIPWANRKEKSTHTANRPEQIKEIHEPITKIAAQLAENQSSTSHSRRSFHSAMASLPNNGRPAVYAPQAQSLQVMEIHPPIIKEAPKTQKKPVNKFEEEALNAKYDLIPTKVRNAPFGKCYFARHRSSKNVVLIALILQHVFDRFEGQHGEAQLIELMKSADPNLRGLRERIQCSGSVALVMDITLSEFSNSETLPHQNGARLMRASDPSIALNGVAEHAMDQRDEEDEIEDFMSELDSQSFPTPWTPKSESELPEVAPRKEKISSDHFRKEVFSFETYEQPKVEENREDTKTTEETATSEPETHDIGPSGQEETVRGQTYVSSDSSEDEVAKSRKDRSRNHSSPKKGRSRHRRNSEKREDPEEMREMPEGSSRGRRQSMKAQSVERRTETREKIRQRRRRELSERRRNRTGKSKSGDSKGRERLETQDSFSTNSSDSTSVNLRPTPPKNLTFWKLLTSLELADCMPLAALDETMDFHYGRDNSSRRGRRISRRNSFDTFGSSKYSS